MAVDVHELPQDPELLLRERAWLTALARRLVRRDEQAEDVAHDAMAAAVLRGVPAGVGPRRWLAAILEKQLAGRRRSAHRRAQHELQAGEAEPAPPAADVVARFEVQRAVADAVVALAEPYRTCVLLRFWDGLPPRRIAARLAVPVETVRTRLKRGIAMLRERLDGTHGGDRRAWTVPLLVATQPLHTVSMPLMVLTLMTTLQKAVALVLLAIAVVVMVNAPWRTTDVVATTPVEHREPAPVAASVEVPDAAPVGSVPERVEVTAGEAPAPGVVVTGVVVDAATQQPLADVPVELIEWPHRSRVVANALTDARGAFRIEERVDEEFVVRGVVVRADDFAATSLQVPGSEASRTVDLGVLECVRGTLFRGRVVDVRGDPVPRARLLLPAQNISWGGWGPQRMLADADQIGTSDDDGHFSLAVPIGPDPNHGDLLFAVADTGIGWVTFEATRSRRVVDDLLVRLRPGATLQVRIEGAEGRAIAGAAISVMPRFGPLGLQHGGTSSISDDAWIAARFTGRSDQSGELVLAGLPLGDADLPMPSAAGWRRYELRVVADGYPEPPPQTVELHAERPTVVTVRLDTAQQVMLAVEVRDDTGAPVAGAEVAARGVTTATASTDVTGRARLELRGAGPVQVTASRAGHATARVELRSAALPNEPVQLVLKRTCELRGRVVDQFEVGVAGLTLFRDGRSCGRTDARGEFAVRDFPVGPVELAVALPPGGDQTEWITDGATPVVDAASGPVTIVWQRRPGRVPLRVDVVDSVTGEPLEIVEAELRLFLDPPGMYLLGKPIERDAGAVVAAATAAGRWRLDVRAIDGRRGSLPFELNGGEGPTTLRLPLALPGTVTGRLRFVDCAPPEHLTLAVAFAVPPDPTVFVQFHYPGRWRPEPASQTVESQGDTGMLRMQPQLDPTFRLDEAHAGEELVFRVVGKDFTGSATVKLEPGAVRDIVVEVRAR